MRDALAGGGFEEYPQQQQWTQQTVQPQIIVVEDGGPWVITGVLVPVLIAIVGWWLHRRWAKQHPGEKLWHRKKK